MKCPTCPDSTLLMSERQGVEIDYCPQCRGVWLDRGELDKLLQLSANPPPAHEAPRHAAPPAQSPYSNQRSFDQRGFDDSDFGRQHRHGGYRKKSWLSDFFD